MKLHTGDTVLVIAGKDRGKSGTILRILRKDHRAVVGGINMRTRHFKKTAQEPGRKVRFEASISAANLMLLDPKEKKPTRIGFTLESSGKKKRMAKRSGEAVTHVKLPREVKKKAEPPEVKKAEITEKKEAAKKGQPFWKRIGLGSAASEEAEVPTTPRSKEDQSIPSQEIHVRTTGRGS